MDSKTQFCIIGLETVFKHFYRFKELYSDCNNEFVVMDNKNDEDELYRIIHTLNFYNMKCCSLINKSEEELIDYWNKVFKSCDNFNIIQILNQTFYTFTVN